MSINTQPDVHELVMIASIFVTKNNKILMIRRSDKKTYLPGYVQPIGGKIDLNESPLTAAKRELKEEANIEVADIKLKAVVTEVKSKGDDLYKTNWQIFHFSGKYKEKDNNKIGTTDEGELIWLTLEEIKKEKIADSIKLLINHILIEDDSLAFATYTYSEGNELIKHSIEII